MPPQYRTHTADEISETAVPDAALAAAKRAIEREREREQRDEDANYANGGYYSRQISAADSHSRHRTHADSVSDSTPELRASPIFRDLVQRDPCVCSNCFRVTHDAVAFDRYTGTFGWETIEYWYSRPDRVTSAHHDRLTYGLTTACSDCGEISHGKRRPIPFPLACEYAEHILDTLAEKNVTVDVDIFRGEVRDRKRDPNTQGREDSDVFAPAVDRALVAANTRTDAVQDAD